MYLIKQMNTIEHCLAEYIFFFKKIVENIIPLKFSYRTPDVSGNETFKPIMKHSKPIKPANLADRQQNIC